MPFREPVRKAINQVTVTVTQGDNSATPITQPTCGGLSNVTPGKWSATVNVSDRTKFPTGPVTITVNHSNGGSGDLALNAKPASQTREKDALYHY